MEKASKQTDHIIRIGITGPESSGKSWLAEHLAHEFNDLWLPEYAREFLTGLQRPYEVDDLHIMAAEQLRREDEYSERAGKILFCDTDAVVLKIWYEHKFGIIPDFITNALLSRRYDWHFLMMPDLPYEEDPLRENPGKGKYFFSAFRNTLDLFGLPYTIISGPSEERIKKAGDKIRQLLDIPPA